MGNIFAITTPTEDINADAAGKAKAIFTVTNTSHKPVRGMAQAKSMGNTEQNWLDIEGETERDFGAGRTEQFVVNFNSSSGPAGKFPFRLDVASSANPDELFTEGPAVNVLMAAPAPVVQKTPFPWLIIIIIAAVLLLLIIGGILFFALRGSGSKPTNPPIVNNNKPSNLTPVVGKPVMVKPILVAKPITATFKGMGLQGPIFHGIWVSKINTAQDGSGAEQTFKEIYIQQDTKSFSVSFFGFNDDWSMGPFEGKLVSGALEVEGDSPAAQGEVRHMKFNLKLTGPNELTVTGEDAQTGKTDSRPVPRQVFVRVTTDATADASASNTNSPK